MERAVAPLRILILGHHPRSKIGEHVKSVLIHPDLFLPIIATFDQSREQNIQALLCSSNFLLQNSDFITTRLDEIERNYQAHRIQKIR
jgi:hypothetical protein